MYRKKYVTQAEIVALLDASSSEDEEETATLIRKADNVDLVLLPPPRVLVSSDVEDIDEDAQIQNDATDFAPTEVAGEIEVVCEFDEGNQNIPDGPDDYERDRNGADDDGNDADGEGEAPSSKKKKKSKPITYTAKWSKKKKSNLLGSQWMSLKKKFVGCTRNMVCLFHLPCICLRSYLHLFIVIAPQESSRQFNYSNSSLTTRCSSGS